MSVDLDPQVKRSPEKLAKELRDLNDVIQDKVGLKEFDVIVSFFVGNVDYLDILTLDDGVAPDLTQLLSQAKVSNDQVDDLLRKVSETGGANKFQALLRMVQLARDKEYEKLVAVSREIFGKNVSGAPLRVLYSVVSNLKDYEYLAEVLSANNIFEPDVLHNFLMSKPSRPEMAGVAQNYLKHQNRKAAVEYLKEASRISNDPEISLLASQVLIETGDVTSAGQLLSNIRFEDLQKEDDFDKLITGLITCEDYKHALRISNYASQQFKKSPRFVTRKAMCLKSLGRGDDALEVLDSWHQKKDTEIAKEKAAILYDLKRFQEYADLIHTMNPDGVSDPAERERYLSALLEGSRFNEALQEIGKSLAKVPNDPGVLQQKFKLQTMLNDISGAYETAERILAVDKANRECSAFVLDYLFGNGEYEKFIERFGSLSKNSGYSKGPLVAALIFSAQVDDAIERIRSDHSYLKQPEVIDALFFTLREEEQVDTVLEICENDGFDLAAIAMSRIKGK